MLKLILSAFFFSSFLMSATPKCLYLESPGYIRGAGMFHNFNIVLGCLAIYDANPYLSLQIDFKDQGLYYNAKYGNNWWSYYFEKTYYPARISSVKRAAIKVLKDEEKAELGNSMHFYGQKEKAHELIVKYLRVKPEILQKVHKFSLQYLQAPFVIGVHYRGSDKWLESNFVSYTQMIDRVVECIHDHPDAVVFVSTDEQGFLDAIQQVLPNQVVFTQSARSQDNKPLHYNTEDGYIQGKEALIDCLLLSKSDLLIRTNSNLSAVSAFFNPKMKVINVNTLGPDLFQGISQKGTLNSLQTLSDN